MEADSQHDDGIVSAEPEKRRHSALNVKELKQFSADLPVVFGLQSRH
jgi:hypothetical protein